MTAQLLEVSNLTVSTGSTSLVDDVSFTLQRGSRTGLIGESGSGKTLTALAIMGLLADGLTMEGSVVLNGDPLHQLRERQLIGYRGNAMSMIFQEPMTALNPVMRVGRQIAEPLRIHRGMGRSDAVARAVELLASVGIEQPERRARAFTHELSGGQRQRAMIALALACGPDLVIADEPTTALDVTVQAQVLSVLQEQVDANDAALLLITHDLPVVAAATEDVIVLRDGAVVESGPTRRVFDEPDRPYTTELVASVPPMSRSLQIPPPDHRWRPPVDAPIVEARDVVKAYKLRRRRFGERAPEIHAVDDVTLEVHPGETFGIVGESGSGKSTLARLMLGLERATSGTIMVDGIDVTAGGNLRPLRDVAQMVFQDPMGSLDPRMLVEDIVAEPLRSLHLDGNHGQRVRELLEAVSLPADSAQRYPHEFSGGQRQRIAIARALAPAPKLLVADEPVSALDMSVQTVTLELLDQLKQDFDLTMVFISHDLSVVHQICERVVVLEAGQIVESGFTDDVFRNPQQTYTRDLIAAIPRLDGTFLAAG